MFFTPLFLLADVNENFRKHFLAPRARDQEEMNSYFTGTEFELAERYTVRLLYLNDADNVHEFVRILTSVSFLINRTRPRSSLLPSSSHRFCPRHSCWLLQRC